MPDTLQVIEETQLQGSGESIKYTIDTDNYPTAQSGNPPTLASAVVILVSDDSDVTDDVMSAGSVTINGTVITLKPLTALTAGKTYRVQATFTKDTNIWQPYFQVRCPY